MEWEPDWTLVLEDGKYHIKHFPDGSMHCQRYENDAWREIVGDKLILALCHRVMELEESLESMADEYRRMYSTEEKR